jgi:putative endopeptidase
MISLRAAGLISLFACTLALSPAPANQNKGTVNSTEDIDLSIRAGDDFYHYSNGIWLRTAVIPAGQASYDTRSILAARTSQRVRDLIQEAAAAQSAKGSVAQKVGDYYAGFMDESSIGAKGMTPLTDEMAAISAINNKKSLSA